MKMAALSRSRPSATTAVQLQPHPKRRICVAPHPARRELFADRSGAAGGSCVEPAEGGTATTGLMMLEAGQELNNMNVGAIEACEIGDTVWLDGNGNGLQDYGEGRTLRR